PGTRPRSPTAPARWPPRPASRLGSPSPFEPGPTPGCRGRRSPGWPGSRARPAHARARAGSGRAGPGPAPGSPSGGPLSRLLSPPDAGDRAVDLLRADDQRRDQTDRVVVGRVDDHALIEAPRLQLPGDRL